MDTPRLSRRTSEYDDRPGCALNWPVLILTAFLEIYNCSIYSTEHKKQPGRSSARSI
ncbi:hypothetical protein RSAG8_12678, partial [Rhizoctonia solani AG-8 WAC10335]